MQTMRYSMRGNWYRGNTHLHTRLSDGGLTPKKVAEQYGQAGYDFMFYTDHWVASNVRQSDSSMPLLFNGVEIDGRDEDGSHYHMVGLGDFTDIQQESGLCTALKQIEDQGGILVLAHPAWMGNSVADSLKYSFQAVEVYNHVCRSLNGKGDSTYVWDAMLESRPGTLALSVDDAHITAKYPSWAGGWIMVNSEERTHAAIWQGIREGNYYSTNGPRFQSIVVESEEAATADRGDADRGAPADTVSETTVRERTVQVHTSPVHFIRLVGPRYSGYSLGEYGGFIDRASLKIPSDWAYARIEIEGPAGLRAWTNSLFV